MATLGSFLPFVTLRKSRCKNKIDKEVVKHVFTLAVFRYLSFDHLSLNFLRRYTMKNESIIVLKVSSLLLNISQCFKLYINLNVNLSQNAELDTKKYTASAKDNY